MFHQLTDWVVNLVSALGYFGVFLGMTIESTLIPLPSEIIMIPAGYLAFKGEFSTLWLIIFGAAGNLFGSVINYYFSLFFGRKVVYKIGKWLFMSQSSLKKGEDMFRRHGDISTFIARLIPVARHVVSVVAGLARMNFLRFCTYTFLGSVIWAAVLVYFGYFLGKNGDLMRENAKYLQLGALIFAAFVIAIYAGYRKFFGLKKSSKPKLVNEIIITAGGTGGHIFPALNVGLDLNVIGKKVIFITDKRFHNYASHALISRAMSSAKFTFITLDCPRPTDFLSVLKFAKSCVNAFLIVFKSRSLFVFGFGGYVSFPALLSGFICGKKIILHEQNAILGKINHAFYPFAKICFTTFPKTIMPRVLKTKIRHVGLPISLPHIKNKTQNTQKITIVLTGGSQGSATLSEVFLEAMISLKQLVGERQLTVYHQCSNHDDIEQIEQRYDSSQIKASVSRFFTNLPDILSESDIVISRSGAGSVVENCIMRKAAIYVPLQNSAREHQALNASEVFLQGGCLVLKESDLSVETLLKSIKILLDDPETAEITRENAHNMFETKASLLIRANLLALEIGMSVKDFK